MAVPEISLSNQPADMRLHILLAKVRLSSSEMDQARDLLGHVQSWSAFTDVARRNFSLPLLRFHLSRIDGIEVPEDIWNEIQKQANDTAFYNMRMIAAQKRFRDMCLASNGVDGVFFKGVNMAVRFYGDAGLRPCRDIDVLVPPDTIRTVLQKAVDTGYVPVSPEARPIPIKSERDIDAVLRFGESVTLVTPEGVVIDLQDRLDKHSGIFSQFDVFAQSVPSDVGGTRFQTLPTAFLFNYLCHHHTRHTWSRLHWLSDLDAICTSEHFDQDETLSLSETLGQSGTVKASLELRQLMSTDTVWDDSADMSHGKTFLKLSILNLPGDLALEKKLGMQMIGGEFMYRWQARPDLITKARRGWWRTLLQPTVSHYARMPLPRALQWLYVYPRLADIVYRTIKRVRPIKR